MVDHFSLPFLDNGRTFGLVAHKVLEVAGLHRPHNVLRRLLLVVVELWHRTHGLGAQTKLLLDCRVRSTSSIRSQANGGAMTGCWLGAPLEVLTDGGVVGRAVLHHPSIINSIPSRKQPVVFSLLDVVVALGAEVLGVVLVEHADAGVYLVGVQTLLLIDHHPIVYHDVGAAREDLVAQAVGASAHPGASIDRLVIGSPGLGGIILREAHQQLLKLRLFGILVGRLPLLAVTSACLLLLLWVQIKFLLLLPQLLLDELFVEGEDVQVLVDLPWLLIHLHSEPSGRPHLLAPSKGRVLLLPTAVLLINLGQAMKLALVGDSFLVNDVIFLEELLQVDDPRHPAFGLVAPCLGVVLAGDEL